MRAGSARGASCLPDDREVKGIKEEMGVPQFSSKAHTQ